MQNSKKTHGKLTSLKAYVYPNRAQVARLILKSGTEPLMSFPLSAKADDSSGYEDPPLGLYYFEEMHSVREVDVAHFGKYVVIFRGTGGGYMLIHGGRGTYENTLLCTPGTLRLYDDDLEKLVEHLQAIDIHNPIQLSIEDITRGQKGDEAVRGTLVSSQQLPEDVQRRMPPGDLRYLTLLMGILKSDPPLSEEQSLNDRSDFPSFLTTGRE